MDSIGDRLRQERLRRGISIEEIAERTKIHASMLAAIEADDLAQLPGNFFTRSFVRQYARVLELDESEFDEELDTVTSPESAEEQAPAPAEKPSLPPISSGSFDRGHGHSLGALIAFVLIVVACSAVYSLWQRNRSATPAEHPARSAAAQPKGVTPPAPTTPQQAAPPAPAQSAPAATVPPSAATPALTQGSSAAAPGATTTPAPQEAAAQEPVPAPSSLAPGETAAMRVEVLAKGEEWIRLIADGKNIFSGTLHAGDKKVFEGMNSMNLRVGNPGLVDVIFNGKPVGSIGPSTQPRTVQFTPEGFKVLSPAPPPPPDLNGAP